MNFDQLNSGLKILYYCLIFIFILGCFKFASIYFPAQKVQSNYQLLQKGLGKDQVINDWGSPMREEIIDNTSILVYRYDATPIVYQTANLKFIDNKLEAFYILD